MIARRLPVLAAGAALVLAACGGSSDGDASTESTLAVAAAPTVAPAAEAPTSTGSPAATDAPVAVPAALDFTASLLGGGEIEMGQFAGRPVLLWFWAPW